MQFSTIIKTEFTICIYPTSDFYYQFYFCCLLHTRNDDELDHIEENGSTYCEINPDDELQSDTNINKHPDINEGYEHLANRSQKDPYNQLNQESAHNQIGDMINVDDCTEDSPASDYIDIES